MNKWKFLAKQWEFVVGAYRGAGDHGASRAVFGYRVPLFVVAFHGNAVFPRVGTNLGHHCFEIIR
jgi:hypothetical protein